MTDSDIIHEDLGYTVSAWNREQAGYIERMKTNKDIVSKMFSNRLGQSLIMRKHKDISDHDAFWQRAKRHDIHLLARKVIEKFRESIERTGPLYSENNTKPTSQSTQRVKNKQTSRSSGNELIRVKESEIKYKLPSIKTSSQHFLVGNSFHEHLVVNEQSEMLGRWPSSTSLEDKLKNHYREQCKLNDNLADIISLKDQEKCDEEIVNPPPSPDVLPRGNENCWGEISVYPNYEDTQENKKKIVVMLPNIYSDSETHFHPDINIDVEKLTTRPVSEKPKPSEKPKKGRNVPIRKVVSSSSPTRFIEKRTPGASNGGYKFDTEISTGLARQRLNGLPPLQISFHSKVNLPVKYVIRNANLTSRTDGEAVIADTNGSTTPDPIFQTRHEIQSSSSKFHKVSIPLVRSETDKNKLSVIGVNPNVPLNLSYEERRTSLSSQSSKSSKDSMGNRLSVIILNKKRAKQQNKRNVVEEDVSKAREEKLVDHYRKIASSGLSHKEKSRRKKLIRSEVYAREKLRVSESRHVKENKSTDLEQASPSDKLKNCSNKQPATEPKKPSHMSEFVFRVYMRQKELEHEGLPKIRKTVEQNKYLRHCGPMLPDTQMTTKSKASSCSNEFRQKLMLDTLNRKTINL